MVWKSAPVVRQVSLEMADMFSSRQWYSEPYCDEIQNNKKGTKRNKNTYNSGYSLVVTHPTTNPPISSLCMAERTGCPILLSLWSYVTAFIIF